MTREEMVAALGDVKSELHAKFPAATTRLEQFDSHLATVVMVVEHIFDEAERSVGGN